MLEPRCLTGGAESVDGSRSKLLGVTDYITAFALDNGESVGTLIKDPLPGAPVPPIMPPQDGFLFLYPFSSRRMAR